MSELPESSRWRTLLTVGGGYLLFGVLWIMLSDGVLHQLAPDRAALTQWQSYKGLVFVVASAAVITLLLVRETGRRRAVDRYWRDVIDHAEEGFWLIDAEGRTVAVNRTLSDLLGYTPAQMRGHTPFDFAAPDGQAVFEEQVGREPGTGLRCFRATPRHYEVTLLTRQGEALPMLVYATSLWDASGRLTGSYAFLTDLTDIRARQRELDLTRYAVAHSFDEILRAAPDGRILDANEAACRKLGYSREELLELTVSDIDPNYPPAAWREHWQDLERSKSLSLESVHRARDGTTFPVELGVSRLTYAGEDFAYAVARDITERKAAEAASHRANRALRALSRANAAVVHAADESALFGQVCQALSQSHDYPLAWVGIAEDNPDRTVRVAGATGEAQGYLEGIELRWGDDAAGQGPTGRAIRTGETQVLRRLEEQPAHAPWREAARAYGFRASAALPLVVEGRTIGALNVYSSDPDAFDEQEVELLQELAGDLGFGVQTLQMRAERDRQLSQLRLAGAVFDNTAEGILVTDPQTRIETVNRAFTRITGYTAEEAIGRTPALVQSGLLDEAFYRAMWASIEAEDHWQGEIWNRRKNGETYPEWLSISAVRDEAGTLTHYVGVFADISRSHQTQEELLFCTYHDPLTELPNRALFRERLGHAIGSGHEGLAVVMIDLRDFGAINDSFGAEAGDTVLRRTAERLVDALPERDTVARPGGDEFWVLMEGLARREALEHRLATLSAAISAPLSVGEQTLRVEANMGVALAPDDSTDVETLLTSAATALHRAQADGREPIQYFQAGMHQAVQHRVRLAEAMKAAIERGELEVWYQPQVSLLTGDSTQVEALVRWRHPEWGLISPGEFVPIAEATGLIAPIGDWVLEQALEQWLRWRAAGYRIDAVAVNVAAAQLQHPSWAERVREALQRTGVPAQALELEITEEGFLANLEQAAETMHRLKALGVRLAIDDFGTGYSSLAYLKQLPVDILKIDKTFIDGLPDHDYDRSIAEAILAVAGALGLKVVAEGVEREDQAEWLRAHGVEWVQGFLYYAPQPPAQVESWLTGS